MKTHRHFATFGTILALLGALQPANTLAQDVDVRWAPWIGCWEAANVSADDLLCVRPGDDALTVEIVRTSGSTVLAREVVWADGARHETSREGCEGWESGTFSEDGRRLITRSEHRCGGDAVREGGGIMSIVEPDEWLDVRMAGMGGERTAWVQRYLPVSTARVEALGFDDPAAGRSWSGATARALAAAPIDVDDVVEISRMLAPEAVNAFLVERGDPLALDAAQLERMAAAGVPEAVIDVAIAVSYPDKFVLSADGDVAASEPDGLNRRRRIRPGYGRPIFFDPFYYGYDPYRYGYGYYGYYGYSGYYGYRPSIVVVERPLGEHGRVVNGRGYTRSRASAGTGGGGSRSTGSARASSGARSGSTSASPSRQTTSNPPSRASSSSSRGSSSSSGRTAKRRGGGI